MVFDVLDAAVAVVFLAAALLFVFLVLDALFAEMRLYRLQRLRERRQGVSDPGHQEREARAVTRPRTGQVDVMAGDPVVRLTHTGVHADDGAARVADEVRR